MKSKLLVATIVGIASILGGCASATSLKVPQSYFNKQEFTGLVELPENGADIVLNYELDQTNGKVAKITSCSQVKGLSEGDVIAHQYKLYRLLSVNCHAAEQFLSGELARQSFFLGQSLLKTIPNFPATAVPNLGGDGLDLRKGKILSEFETSIKSTDASETAVSVVLSDILHVNYVLLARKDINQDGAEDLILRMDWSIPDSFGSGSTLIALSKKSKTSPIVILWRFK